jgi:hypothetical protein
MENPPVNIAGPVKDPPHVVRWAFEPARASSAPQRDRLERASFRRGWKLIWDRIDAPDGFTTLVVSLIDTNLVRQRRVAFTRKSDTFDEGQVAEGVAEWIMDPMREGGPGEYRPAQS